ncbi:hypothetical protein BGZ70_004817 [Mortierella alpina]|uniref:F-box domain-containing protein n=1 Tax=Mortierella alpina TaxID=64518 RepID=A0A9P6IQF2_MORAP|nr:hypothetical protein BGZ70_004817 [Mortierella alpina]
MLSSSPDSPQGEDQHTHGQLYYTDDSAILHNYLSSFSDAYDSSQEDHSYEEAFYDQYDVQLVPRQTHRPRASKLKQRSETKVLLPIRKTSRKCHLFPMEVLDLVCSHLSQAALRFSVSLVSKKWYAVSKRHISRRNGVWKDPTKGQESRLLEHMPNLHTLECWFGSTTGSQHAYDKLLLSQALRTAWDRFMTAITAPLQASDRDPRIESAGPECLLHYIRRLVFKGLQMTYEVSVPQILGQLHFLQSLELHVCATDIPLFELLNSSPSLTELKVVGQRNTLAQVVSGDEEDLIRELPDPITHPATAQLPRRPPAIDPPRAYSERYKLRIFDVSGVVVKQRVLERLIATCPGLRVFKVHEINAKIWLPELSISRHHPIDEERLWIHLQDCCPKIEWYFISLMANRGSEGMVPLKRMCQSNTLGRFLTTSCSEDWLDHLEDDALRALPRITVLEVLPKTCSAACTKSLHQLLCLMPNLLHLIAGDMNFQASAVLVPPGCTRPEALRKEFIYHNRDRKRQEREEKRQQRQRALDRFQGSPQNRITVIPEIWQCRDLRTMTLDLGGWVENFSLFTQYVAGHRLLRNLTSLAIGICHLRVGQVKGQPTADKALPERWENDFLLLRGLRCLETLDVKTYSILGVVQATDFEFLRRQDHSQVILYIAATNKDAGSDLDEDLAGNRPRRRRKDSTFWPHLQSLHVTYACAKEATNFSDVVAGIQQIRPGVEFTIEHQLHRRFV